MNAVIQSLGAMQFFFSESVWEDSYNSYEVHRSRFGEAGPYEVLHASEYGRASFLVPPKDAYDVDGLQLELLVNRTREVTVTFSGTTPANVATAFNNALPSVLEASSSADGVLVQTVEVGHNATILATSSEAWHNLHMTDLFFFGKSAYQPLVSGQSNYLLTDYSAEEGWYYKTRFRHRITGAVSDFAAPIAADVNVAVTPSDMILGEAVLVDPSGTPLRNVVVMVDVPYDASNPGMIPTQVTKRTDENGYISMLLLRGIRATVAVAGTSIYREVQVPATGNSFDLLDLGISTQSDVYSVQVPDIKVGERRSM